MMPNTKVEGNTVHIECEGKKFRVDVSNIKRKKLLKLAKIIKKNKEDSQALIEAMDDAGFRIVEEK